MLSDFRRLNDSCLSKPSSPSKKKSFHLGLSNLIRYLQYDFSRGVPKKKMCSLGNLESPPQQMFKKKTGFVSIREVDSTPRQKYLMVGIVGFKGFLD